LQSSGAIRRSLCQLVSAKPGSFRNTQSCKQQTYKHAQLWGLHCTTHCTLQGWTWSCRQLQPQQLALLRGAYGCAQSLCSAVCSCHMHSSPHLVQPQLLCPQQLCGCCCQLLAAHQLCKAVQAAARHKYRQHSM
jgi:hypothetical protein